ncbi:LemA family protein [Neisseria sp. CCUG17229]|uniref:LemA family protein n=1 Tax=Neisseria brasiliensis TaxID=2666100 RepID=A0A5Q3S6H5_9NEIS|nr:MULTISPECIES: LemA family protein [Neisseria]MRN39146.1 LemA family protein [Neisseria brasiliensis]PJO10243.1 LemA family protein [Neisseria sp. N95_16]PJO77969.1 LemA family protein [Neisseria sp. N177_16]QGL26513.1 LemA family protein [Neisseria brasiliensis]
MFKKWLAVLAVMTSMFSLSGCGYNTMQTQDEAANAAWSEVLNQYQRRADLIPNLVNTVKGYATHEEEVFTKVTEARSKVGSMQLSAEDASNPEKLKQFQQAQGELSGALSRLLVVSENYPQLKADQNFRDLQAQLEGTENRISIARNSYIKAVQTYNTTLRQFPQNITAKIFGMQPRANFSVENEGAISNAPAVQF